MRIANPAAVFFAAALLIAALWPVRRPDSATALTTNNSTVEWAEAAWLPQEASPIPLRLSALEQRFARQFPGHIARFTDGRHEWVVRVMDKPTRMLHPAADCFRGLGYKVTPPRVRVDHKGENWRCFTATRNGKNLRVCERIFDGRDGRWTDTSSWYWSALLGKKSQGPWWAVTKVEAGD
jgi:hypothetical protein